MNDFDALDPADEAQVQVVADAMYSFAVDEARNAALSADLHLDRLESTFDLCFTESDRSVAILTFALAEELMLHAFKRHLNGEIAGGWKKITSSHGVLATASDRITLLALLKWIQPSVFSDLMLLKSIRNEFAHRSDIHSFDEKPISGFVTSLSAREKVIRKPEYQYENAKFSLRSLYMMRAFCTVIRLMMNLAVGPNAITQNVDPSDVEGREWVSVPEKWKAANRLMAKYLLQLAAGSKSDLQLPAEPTGES